MCSGVLQLCSDLLCKKVLAINSLDRSFGVVIIVLIESNSEQFLIYSYWPPHIYCHCCPVCLQRELLVSVGDIDVADSRARAKMRIEVEEVRVIGKKGHGCHDEHDGATASYAARKATLALES